MGRERAILLINTGSPESLRLSDVRRYLTNFLMDGRVFSVPQPFRALLVKGIIAPLRASKSRDKYQLIWQEEGAPLQLLTEALARRVETLSGITTLVAMTYNHGSIERAYREVAAREIEEVVLVPLFPQYAMSSYEATVVRAIERHKRGGYAFALKCVRPYFDHPLYTEILLQGIEAGTESGDHLVFSYHGIPISHTKAYKADREKDYEWQCQETTRLVTEQPRFESLGLTYEVAYQSRFGGNKWLSPVLDDRVASLHTEGKRRVAVICPSFVCDCLETSWEVSIHLKQKFGGDHFQLIPCPNDTPAMAEVIIDQVKRHATDAEKWSRP